MQSVRKVIKAILPYELIEIYRLKKRKSKFKHKNIKETFNAIADENFWSSEESVSGPGSELQHTQTLIAELNSLFEEYKISTVLDLPCGDFNWMRKVDLSNINYLGADIVEDIIEENKLKYQSEYIEFEMMDIITSNLGKHDLVLVRDCLVHFSYVNIVKTIKNLKRSGSKYLLTTTFPGIDSNKDIVSGEWRPLNFAIYPFFFPKPIELLNENYQGKEKYKSKSMALWEINDLRISFRLRLYCTLHKIFN
ncbi:class I SAM-dependent methyltransferase [Winogradskyella litorisediminis]|uniref:Class I SAM-dependent methyltransferase n=1 Tax=Winogradskyella litorisediminis TaxID=1156618 RepID=A0ABW3N8Z9_9FLAO